MRTGSTTSVVECAQQGGAPGSGESGSGGMGRYLCLTSGPHEAPEQMQALTCIVVTCIFIVSSYIFYHFCLHHVEARFGPSLSHVLMLLLALLSHLSLFCTQASFGGRLKLLLDLAACSPAWRDDVAELTAPAAAAAADTNITDLAQLFADLARVLAHRDMYTRLDWLLQQHRSGAQQQAGQHAAAAAGEAAAVEAPGSTSDSSSEQQQEQQQEEQGQGKQLQPARPGRGGRSTISAERTSKVLQLLGMSESRFGQRFPGFVAWQRDRQAAAAAAQKQQHQDER